MDIYQNLKDIMESVSPLSYEEQRNLIEKSQNGDNDAKNQLVLTNLAMIHQIAAEFKPPPYFTEMDMVNEGVIALMNAILKVDSLKQANLYLFFTNAIRWHLTDFVRKESQWNRRTESLNENLSDSLDRFDENPIEKLDIIEDKNASNLIDDLEASEAIKTYLCYCKPEEQIIIILSFGIFGFSAYAIAEISKLVKMKHTAIIEKKKSAIEKMYQSNKDPTKSRHLPPRYKLIDLDHLRQLIKDCKLAPKK